MHYPKDRGELGEKLAAAHAQAVSEKVKSMSCPAEQKEKLIKAIKKKYQSKKNS